MSYDRSEEEGVLLQFRVSRYISNIGVVDGDSVSKHAWSWNLDRISPVGIVVAESICEIQNSLLGKTGSVLGYVEMSRLGSTLCNGMWDEEKVKYSFFVSRLLNEALIDIGALRRIQDIAFM